MCVGDRFIERGVPVEAAYLVLVELGKRLFFGAEPRLGSAPRRRGRAHRVSRRAARFSAR
jgi:hypothetical protein